MDIEVTSSAAPEEGAGENVQGVAAPAASGEEGRELAEPGAGEQGGQSAEERHRQAEARRKAERESYKAQLKQELEAENAKKMDSIIASMGRVNPFTKKPINTMAELEEYNRENDKRKKAERLSKLGISQEDFDELVENHPTVKAAKEAAAALQQQKAELVRAQQDEELRAEMAEISKIDPNIKTPTDLMNHPMYAEVKKLVQENDHSIAEAFRIATEPARAKEQNDRVRQSAAMAASGKSHLSSMQAAGGTAPQITVPEAVMKGYRLSNPKITPEEARKKYARYLALKRI
ncbi:MAG: hypothetical protein MRZ37_01955 [Tenericutes bacterium]|nr:hypothetical protein [Mycoplasmatota bacterium]